MLIFILDLFWIEELHLREVDVVIDQRSNVEERNAVVSILPVSETWAFFEVHVLAKRQQPAVRNLPQWRENARKLFMAGEAEVDEPLSVEGAGHFLQNPDASLIVFDQIVVGGEDA